MLAMDVNDNARCLKALIVRTFFASKLAPAEQSGLTHKTRGGPSSWPTLESRICKRVSKASPSSRASTWK
ncbi:hypothetical protein EQV97_03075 [Pseudomonas sp. TMW22090]|nr:hypothetical protein [Pseudomonas sp. TMW22090]